MMQREKVLMPVPASKQNKGVVLRHLKSAGVVRKDDVADELVGDNADFASVARNLAKELNEDRTCLSNLFEITLPEICWNGKTLWIKNRHFVEGLRGERAEDELDLATRFVKATKEDGSYLLPRNGPVYLGYGTQVLHVARVIASLLATKEFKDCSFCTINFEVATLMYLMGLDAYVSGSDVLRLPHNEQLDWNGGFIRETSSKIEYHTAVFSAQFVRENGVLYTDNTETSTLSSKAIANAGHSFCVVGKNKFTDSGGGEPIVIPDGKKITIVTNYEPPEIFTNHWEIVDVSK